MGVSAAAVVMVGEDTKGGWAVWGSSQMALQFLGGGGHAPINYPGVHR